MNERAHPAVAIIGAGRVGQALGRALGDAGYPVAEVLCRSMRSARAAVRFIGSGSPRTMRAPGTITGQIVIISTPDDAIAAAASRLARLDQPFEGATVLHTSGSLGASVLDPLKLRGASIASMHPLQSFATPALGVERIPGSVFAVEGMRGAASVAVRMARDVGGRPVRLRPGAKALYHAAAVLASGHVTALLDMSLEAMRGAGLSDEEALSAILPLTKGTLANVERTGTARALTGPFARGDEGTIARNHDALSKLNPSIGEIYDALGRRSRDLTKRG